MAEEHDFSTVPEGFVTDGVPDFPAYRIAYDAALEAKPGEFDATSVPEQFVANGKPDLAAYRIAFDDASALKARDDERLGGLPKDAAGYTFTVPEKIEMPEGFEPPEGFKLEIKEDDPRIPALKALAHEHKLDQATLDAFAGIWAAHEVRKIHDAAKAGADEIKKLGPNAESRMAALSRVVSSRVPKDQAEAFIADLTSADSLRAAEALVASTRGKAPGTAPGGQPDMGDMSIDQRLALASQQRADRRKRA